MPSALTLKGAKFVKRSPDFWTRAIGDIETVFLYIRKVFMNASDFVGAAWKLQYNDQDDVRLVYCYGNDYGIITCWDFTKNGYRNFTASKIGNPQKIDSTIIPLPSECPALDSLITSYRKDGAKTFYNKQGNELVVVKSEPTIEEKMEGATNKIEIPWGNSYVYLFEYKKQLYAVCTLDGGERKHFPFINWADLLQYGRF